VWTLISIISAAPLHYDLVERQRDCSFFTGPVQESGSLPIRAECHWKDISLKTMDLFLDDYEGQTETYSSVAETKILQRLNDITLVYQVHKDKRMSPREGTIEYTKINYGQRIVHTYKLSEFQAPPKLKHVILKEHQGIWSIEKHPDGGIKCIYESTYLPGGSIPAWLVRQFQVLEVMRLIEETRSSVSKL